MKQLKTGMVKNAGMQNTFWNDVEKMNNKEEYMSILGKLDGATIQTEKLVQELLQLECTFVRLQEDIHQLFHEREE